MAEDFSRHSIEEAIESKKKVYEIIRKVGLAREKLEKSLFYKEALKQLENPEMVAQIKRVIVTSPHHSQLQLVLYGLGPLEPVEEHCVRDYHVEFSCMQLAFAILLREKFEWINDIVVFDPDHTSFDKIAMHHLGCTSLLVNEYCKRTVDRPTLFFMPHLPYWLTQNVLNANSKPANLNKIIILGNSLSRIGPISFHDKIESIFNSTHIQREFPLRASDQLTDIHPSGNSNLPLEQKELDPDPVINAAFRLLSWQFFVDKTVNGI